MQNKIELKSHEMMKTDLCKMRGGKSPSRYVSGCCLPRGAREKLSRIKFMLVTNFVLKTIWRFSKTKCLIITLHYENGKETCKIGSRTHSY